MANKRDESPFITTGERVRSFIGWAFVLSIVIHFALAPFLKNMTQHTENQEVEKVSVTKKIIVKPPTPPPTPHPTPTPPPSTPPPKKQVVQPKPRPLKVNLIHTHSNANTSTTEQTVAQPKTGSENGVPAGTGTAAPGPVSTVPPGTPKPACKTPYQDATVVQQAQPEYPDSARELGLGTVTVAVTVTLSPTGALENASVSQSAGNMALDQAALAAARQSTYAPKIVNCEGVDGAQYLFKVTFDPNS
jgi:periplasmic protein TonB